MISTNTKIKAEAQVLALNYGAITLEELVLWADAIIQAQDEPDVGIIELSLSKSGSDAVSALNSIGVSGNKEEVSKVVFTYFYQSLIDETATFEQISKALFDMASTDYTPSPEAIGPMWSLWDDLDIANDGIHGDPEAIKSEILEFLMKFKG